MLRKLLRWLFSTPAANDNETEEDLWWWSIK